MLTVSEAGLWVSKRTFCSALAAEDRSLGKISTKIARTPSGTRSLRSLVPPVRARYCSLAPVGARSQGTARSFARGHEFEAKRAPRESRISLGFDRVIEPYWIGTYSFAAERTTEIQRGVDQADVAERLWEVPEMRAGVGVDLLGEQAERADVGK